VREVPADLERRVCFEGGWGSVEFESGLAHGMLRLVAPCWRPGPPSVLPHKLMT
jgi:hypothetical protein